MSMTPNTPQFNVAGLKSFWARPEGKTGALVLLATIIAGLYGLGMILPWLIALATNMIYLAVEVVALFSILYVVTNKTFRNRMKNIFQATMRGFTNLLLPIYAIDILENSVDQMKENKVKLDGAIAGCNGARQQVKSQITQNESAIHKATLLKEEADRQLTRTTDVLQQQRLTLNRTMQLQEIGRRLKSNEKLQVILDQTTKLYNIMVRWQNLADFNIENTEAQVANAKAERKTILAAYKGMGFAQRLIKGDPEQLQLLNQDLEYLAADNAQKLGEMEDFSRYSEKFLTNMDLEQGAAAGDAEQMLAQYEKKLLSAGGQAEENVPAIMPGDTRQPATIERLANKASGGVYLD